jgi:hypothetical protein
VGNAHKKRLKRSPVHPGELHHPIALLTVAFAVLDPLKSDPIVSQFVVMDSARLGRLETEVSVVQEILHTGVSIANSLILTVRLHGSCRDRSLAWECRAVLQPVANEKTVIGSFVGRIAAALL